MGANNSKEDEDVSTSMKKHQQQPGRQGASQTRRGVPPASRTSLNTSTSPIFTSSEPERYGATGGDTPRGRPGKRTASPPVVVRRLAQDEEARRRSTSVSKERASSLSDKLVVTTAPPKWESDRDHNCCMNCFKSFTVTNRRHHCRQCGKVYCGLCCYQRIRLPHIYGNHAKVRVCVICSSPLFRLSDQQLQYIQLFLPYTTHDKLLRVCKRFQRLVIVPFPKLPSLSARFQYRAATDVIHHGRTGIIYKCMDLQTHQHRAVKVVRKDSMYSRGDWQSLQHTMDTMNQLNHPAFPNLYEVLQTPEALVIVSELIPPQYISLATFASEHKPSETTACRVLYNLLEALSYLHNDAGLVHRSLSPSTVLVDPQQCTVKVTGLKFAKRFRGYIPRQRFTTRQVLHPLADFAPPRGESTVFRYRIESNPVRRPPPIQVHVDPVLEKKSVLYSKTAKHRSDHEKTAMDQVRDFAAPPNACSLVSEAMSICASPRGAPRFAAPEVVEMYASRNPLTDVRLTPEALQKWDIFSAGVLLYTMLTHGKTPWTSSRWEVLALTMNDLSFLKKLPKSITNSCIQLLYLMLSTKPSARCTALQALKSPVFAAEASSELVSPPTAPMERRKKATGNTPYRFRQ